MRDFYPSIKSLFTQNSVLGEIVKKNSYESSLLMFSKGSWSVFMMNTFNLGSYSHIKIKPVLNERGPLHKINSRINIGRQTYMEHSNIVNRSSTILAWCTRTNLIGTWKSSNKQVSFCLPNLTDLCSLN